MNPHGTCETCVWHSVSLCTDADGDSYRTWRCWKDCGEAYVRLVTHSEKAPPACESHFGG